MAECTGLENRRGLSLRGFKSRRLRQLLFGGPLLNDAFRFSSLLDPNVQRFGTVAAGIIGLIAAGGVLYDWCSNEEGEAFTAIGGSSSKDAA